MKYLWLSLLLIFTACVEKPEHVKPIGEFKLERYLGTWYEIARLDHSFERGLEKITATYTMREDGGVKVINRGFDTQNRRWKEAEGKAYFVENPDTGFLKVSFFGPFYGAYIVMDTDYESYTMISGPDHSYLWILSRTPYLDTEIQSHLIAKAKEAGFNTDKLIFVSHQ
ncbi:lipocalin family protein [Sulfurovum sp. zt1-1]|uniref:Lipocalin family protein n=1 Tax=Sulfurovum zhangzhouensis TaxID=3019067 RepID=A0ABT7QW01_9BACT|nr:lipocalin family protein [Sulfurovum zhangzhouensis]MDM5270916.1 lipocalin family protein [Sulfurovum zhangzhouensis]